MTMKKRNSENMTAFASAADGKGKLSGNRNNDRSRNRSKKKNILNGSHPVIRRTTRRRRVVVENSSSQSQKTLEEDGSITYKLVSRRQSLNHGKDHKQGGQPTALTQEEEEDDLKSIIQNITHIPLWSSNNITHSNDAYSSVHNGSNKYNKTTVTSDWEPLSQNRNRSPANHPINNNNNNNNNFRPKATNTVTKKSILDLSNYSISKKLSPIASSIPSSSSPAVAMTRENNDQSSFLSSKEMKSTQMKESLQSTCLPLPLLQSFQKSYSSFLMHSAQEHEKEEQQPLESFKCTCIAASSNQQYMALGDDDGNVYIYTLYPFMRLVSQYSITPFLQPLSSTGTTITTSNDSSSSNSNNNNNNKNDNNILPAILTKKGILQHDTSIQLPNSTLHTTEADSDTLDANNNIHGYESSLDMTTIESLCFCNNPKKNKELLFTLAVATTTHVELWFCHPNTHSTQKNPTCKHSNAVSMSVVKLNTCCIPAAFPYNSHMNANDDKKHQYLCMHRGPVQQFSFQPGSGDNDNSDDKLLLSFTYGNWNKKNQKLLPFIHPIHNNNENNQKSNGFNQNEDLHGRTITTMGPLLCWNFSNLLISGGEEERRINVEDPILKSIHPPVTCQHKYDDNDGGINHCKDEIIIRSMGQWSTRSPASKNEDRAIIMVRGSDQLMLYEEEKIVFKVLISTGIESIHLSHPLPEKHLIIVATRSGGGIQIYNTRDLSHLVTYGAGISLHGHSLSFQQAYLFQYSSSPNIRNSINFDNCKNEKNQHNNISLIAIPQAHKEPLEMTNTIFVWNEFHSSLSQPISTSTENPSSESKNNDICSSNSRHGRSNSDSNIDRKLPSFTFKGPLTKYNGIQHSFTTWQKKHNRNAIIVVTHTGHVQILKSSISTDWAGFMYPPGYRVITKNVMYIEDEDELDNLVDDSTTNDDYNFGIPDYNDQTNRFPSGKKVMYDDSLQRNYNNDITTASKDVLDYDDDYEEDYDQNYNEELEKALKNSLLERKKWNIISTDNDEANAWNENNSLFVPCAPEIYIEEEEDSNKDYYNHDVIGFSSLHAFNKSDDNDNININIPYFLKQYPQWKEIQENVMEEKKARASLCLTLDENKIEETSINPSVTKPAAASSSRGKSRRQKFDRRSRTNFDAALHASINPELRQYMMDREEKWADGRGSGCFYNLSINIYNIEQDELNDQINLDLQKVQEKNADNSNDTGTKCTKLQDINHHKDYEFKSEKKPCESNPSNSKNATNYALSKSESIVDSSILSIEKNNDSNNKKLETRETENVELCLLSGGVEGRTKRICAACQGRWVLHSCGKRTIPEDLEALYQKELEEKESEKQKALEERKRKRKEVKLKQQELVQNKFLCQSESKEALCSLPKLPRTNSSSTDVELTNINSEHNSMSHDSIKSTVDTIDETLKKVNLLKQLYNFQEKVDTAKTAATNPKTAMVQIPVVNRDVTKEQILVHTTTTNNFTVSNDNIQASNDSVVTFSHDNSNSLLRINYQKEKIQKTDSKGIDDQLLKVGTDNTGKNFNRRPHVSSSEPISVPMLYKEVLPKSVVPKQNINRPLVGSKVEGGVLNEVECNNIDPFFQYNENLNHPLFTSKLEPSSVCTFPTILQSNPKTHCTNHSLNSYNDNNTTEPTIPSPTNYITTSTAKTNYIIPTSNSSKNPINQNQTTSIIQQSHVSLNCSSNHCNDNVRQSHCYEPKKLLKVSYQKEIKPQYYNPNFVIPNPLHGKSEMNDLYVHSIKNSNNNESKIMKDEIVDTSSKKKKRNKRLTKKSKPNSTGKGHIRENSSKHKLNQQEKLCQQYSVDHSSSNNNYIGNHDKNPESLKYPHYSSNKSAILASSNIYTENNNYIHNPIQNNLNPIIIKHDNNFQKQNQNDLQTVMVNSKLQRNIVHNSMHSHAFLDKTLPINALGHSYMIPESNNEITQNDINNLHRHHTQEATTKITSFPTSQYSQDTNRKAQKSNTTTNGIYSSTYTNIFSLPKNQCKNSFPFNNNSNENNTQLSSKTSNDHKVMNPVLNHNNNNNTTITNTIPTTTTYSNSKDNHIPLPLQQGQQLKPNHYHYHPNGTFSINNCNNKTSEITPTSRLMPTKSEQQSIINVQLKCHKLSRIEIPHTSQPSNQQQHHHLQHNQKKAPTERCIFPRQQNISHQPQNITPLQQKPQAKHFNEQVKQVHTFQQTIDTTHNPHHNTPATMNSGSLINRAGNMIHNPNNLALLQSRTPVTPNFQTNYVYQQRQDENNPI